MKIAVCSDIHLEFGPIELFNEDNVDVLILSGDICISHDLRQRDSYNIMGEHDRSNKFHKFFQECCARFPHVVYVAGNHEHYHGDFATTIPHLRECLNYLGNLYILDKQDIMIGDVLFIGGTLWTDMNKEDPNTIYAIRGVMNDYRQVQNSNNVCNVRTFVQKDKPVGMTDEEWLALSYEDRHVVKFVERPAQFVPEDSVEDHKAMLAYIDSVVKNVAVDQKVVVVGHHAPSKQSTKPRYEGEHLINGAYSSDLSNFILDRPQIKVWTHGHTHENFDYMIGGCRVICNPRGYIGYEGRADHFELQSFEV